MLLRTLYMVPLIIISFSAIAEQNINHVHIHAPITTVYQYITQPDKWHEWYPSSKSAKTPGGSLALGQKFSEVVTVGHVDTTFSYVVVKTQAPIAWKVEYSSDKVIGSIQYQLLETIEGTLLTRTLEYFPVIKQAEEQPALKKLASQVQPASIKALKTLKTNLEAAWPVPFASTTKFVH
ncbi:SRPBCC family protein [Pseudomaricurvus alkylphenolicus]|uniref:SRPBCC family protein n=1 Tax=Pseudomaricurvus alkylphenolicus TaxID=1306991 RepID=UPI00141E7D4B|nr:SRPBCC family protein [Pseudomaricurvus alkylphenolicus]NIB41731.1 SRPBCC family protein [Pseudomaricurvus alkylphenolicus]